MITRQEQDSFTRPILLVTATTLIDQVQMHHCLGPAHVAPAAAPVFACGLVAKLRE